MCTFVRLLHYKIMKHIFFLLFICLLFSLSAQTKPEAVLHALDQQVEFMNQTDRELSPLYLTIMDLNQRMLDYVEGKEGVNLYYQCNFIPSEEAYKKSVYQRLYLPDSSRDDLVMRLDSFKAGAYKIQKSCEALEKYLQKKEYEKDKMYKGFVLLNQLKKNGIDYLVKHEALHGLLRSVWHQYYIKGLGNRSDNLVNGLERIRSSVHTIYLSLGYDPDYDYANKEILQANRHKDELVKMMNKDSLIIHSADFKKVTEAISPQYFANYGTKNTLPFYKRFNAEYVQEINTILIPACNNLLKKNKRMGVQMCLLPPFITVIQPVIAIEAPQADIVEVAPKPIEVPKIEMPKAEPPKPNDIVETNKAEPVEAPKVSELEGFATNNLIFLLDVSGSMKSGGRLDTMKNAMKYIVTEMRPEDKVGIITYSGTAQVLLKPTSASQKDKILATLSRLNSEGTSNLKMGMDYAVTQMKENKIDGGNNRVIIVTDGYIPLPQDIELMAKVMATQGIALSVFLFSPESDPKANADKLRSIAASGKGNFTAVTRSNARASLLKEAQALKKKGS